MPEQTLLDFADHGELGELLTADGGNSNATLYAFEQARVDVHELADQLQQEGAESFVHSWTDLMACIDAKSGQLTAAR